MATGLEQFRQFTIIVADTGDFGQLEKYKPQDSTTNPSLILASSQNVAYKHLIDDAVKYGKENGSNIDEQVEKAVDKLFVNFGLEILKIIPGRVSTEIDARLSFDTEATVKKAKELTALYQSAGINTKERLLLKIASTWEGLQAAKILESEGYAINMTLLFNIHQAAVAADNGVTLISPFAGRITDFFKAKEGRKDNYPAKEDPGVKSVQNIYNYMRKYDYKTVVMGASFRNKEQVLELAGCDLLTVSPQFLGELQDLKDFTVKKILNVEDAKKSDIPKITHNEKAFRWAMNEDEMASCKLEEGIRKFAADTVKLETEIKKKIQQ